MKIRGSAAILGVSLTLGACGDAVVGAAYRGEPILRITGEIESIGPGVDIRPGDQALVSMFWNTNLARRPATLVPQDSVSTALAFPSAFEIRVFEPPTTAHLVAADGRFGVGLLLVYIDSDHDGAFDAGEPLIGGNLAKAVVWASTPIPATESPFARNLPQGFSLVNQPFDSCMSDDTLREDRPSPGGEATEDPRVGACRADDQCPPEFSCDMRFLVCVPRDAFRLVIGGDFDLSRARCRAR